MSDAIEYHFQFRYLYKLKAEYYIGYFFRVFGAVPPAEPRPVVEVLYLGPHRLVAVHYGDDLRQGCQILVVLNQPEVVAKGLSRPLQTLHSEERAGHVIVEVVPN